MPFDAQAAKKAGYSDGEIADYLGGQAKFDVGAARKSGYSDAEIIGHLGGAGPLQDQAPPPQRSLTQDVTGFMANVNRGLGIGDEMAAGLKTAGNVFSGKTPVQDVGADFKRSMASQRATEDSFAAEHPHLASLAKGTGMAATAVAPVGGANVFNAGSRAVNAVRGATVALGQGAVYAAADRGTPQERLRAASRAAMDPATAVLGAGAGALSKPFAPRTKPAVRQDVIDLRAREVPLTPGQARGGIAKAAEDAATSTPILGTAIQDARHAGLEGYGTATGNEALSHIGETVPKGLPAGHKTVGHVEARLGKAYDAAIPGRQITADPEMLTAVQQRLSDIAQDMTEAGRKRLASILDQRVTGRFRGGRSIDGETFQLINSDLGKVKSRFSGSGDSDQRAIAEAADAMRQELHNAAARQDPTFAARKASIDKGYAIFKRMQGAAASLGAEGGVYTPAQYGGAVRRADRSVDKGASARGEAYGQDFANAGRAVLPSKTPDSGTATRGAYAAAAAAPGALIAAGMSGGVPGVAAVAGGYAATAAGLKLAAKAYTPEAIAAFNKALDGRISAQQQQAALNQLKVIAQNNPKVQALYRQAAEALARSAGAADGARQNVFAAPANP